MALQRDIVIIGAGFAGVWSALAAKRLISLSNKQRDLQVVVIAPEPFLAIRPRLYEADVATMNHPLRDLFDSAGIQFIQATVHNIDTTGNTIQFQSTTGTKASIEYKRLILAAGSQVVRPQTVAGIQKHAFDIDTISAASKLESHLDRLPTFPPSQSRNTIVICGAGFTGLELATELPKRLGEKSGARIILVEGADEVGPELGPGPRPIIRQALEALGVEVRLGSPVTEIDASGVHLASGEYIKTMTAVWTAGMRATPLTQQITGAKDTLGRLQVDQYLRVPTNEQVYATGDAAYALVDTDGHHALMSCQHALILGRVSGHNAAADLLDESMIAYSQPAYNTCLDLGAFGAVVTSGWAREVKVSGEVGKKVKTYINQKLIYPPNDAKEAINAADPKIASSDELLTEMLITVQ
ncbi:hypothetical protein JX266_007138 [Neoarthrinium moseri]|uniref:uncharacterized protein n=1 Tax=Neoarthrinium moseri TaxID=1658444 RepID=UPI001FDD53A9|nr:uncharacterized protein JN550_003610 [Neoarthrinium moseri]KAI1846917.1 hypothetical protein JX266_007138 [Neoarthrinium moseri]KAI1872736.1 hypothetical protein JN550_003610 [Neoarthrinium moseri]